MKAFHLISKLALGFLTCGVVSTSAYAQAPWPTKPVKLIVPAPAGSSLDLIARLLQEKLKDKWAQPIVVENKPGASGMLGTDIVAKSEPDGHTMVIGFGAPISTAPMLYNKMAYSPTKDLTPIIMTTSQANVLAVNANVPAKNVQEFIAWAKTQGGKVNYSSLGQGSSAHLTMELFLEAAGVRATHIPFNGSPPAALSVAQGDAQATFMIAPALLPHVASGKVKMLAVSTPKRTDDIRLKDLPTLVESGLPNVTSIAWNGLFVRAGTPANIVAKINADVNAALTDKAVEETLSKAGMDTAGGTQAEFQKLLDADAKQWAAVIQRLGVKLD
jgi:tripartite-type tricarboxylate transporter receptor subunit TctC